MRNAPILLLSFLILFGCGRSSTVVPGDSPTTSGDDDDDDDDDSFTGPALLTITSPANGSTPDAPVIIEFELANFAIGNESQPHLMFTVDDSPTSYHFVDLGDCDDEDACVYAVGGVHSHEYHWNTANSFKVGSLTRGEVHSFRLVLVDDTGSEIEDTVATVEFTLSNPVVELELEEVADNLDFPISIAFTPDNRLFYTERYSGRIMVMDPVFSPPQTFYQLSDVVAGDPEQGLMGITVDPDFAANGHVYVYYTANSGTNTVKRIRDLGNNVGGEETTIVANLPQNIAHNAGILRFGPDGKLYVSVGDAGLSDESLDPNSLAGKILRVNPDGSSPPDNPFYDGSGGNADKVFALGVKNAFGLAFHPETGDLWSTDNGSAAQDEVNLVPPGADLGWPFVQGFCDGVRDNNYATDELDYCQQNVVTEPVHEISPSTAPTGVVVVGEDSVYPAYFHNSLWFLEYTTGTMWEVYLVNELRENGGVRIIAAPSNGLDIVQAPDGYIYISTCSNSQNCNGKIFRVLPG